jgi:hypothetical protein
LQGLVPHKGEKCLIHWQHYLEKVSFEICAISCQIHAVSLPFEMQIDLP